jgi:hypothetical protein
MNENIDEQNIIKDELPSNESKKKVIKFNKYNSIINILNKLPNKYELYEFCYANDYPIPYKDLHINPMRMDIYKIFLILSDCLILDEVKMFSGDKEAVKMSYLDFLFYQCTKTKDYSIVFKLKTILTLVLDMNESEIDFKVNNNKIELKINNKYYNSKDFDIIRNIICKQNNIEIPNININPQILKLYKEAEALKIKNNKHKSCDIEELKSRITARTGITKSEINKMTIREFTNLIKSLEMIVNYDLEMQLSPHMNKEQFNGIKHWLSSSENKDKYAEYRSEYNSLKKEMNKLK